MGAQKLHRVIMIMFLSCLIMLFPGCRCCLQDCSWQVEMVTEGDRFPYSFAITSLDYSVVVFQAASGLYLCYWDGEQWNL